MNNKYHNKILSLVDAISLDPCSSCVWTPLQQLTCDDLFVSPSDCRCRIDIGVGDVPRAFPWAPEISNCLCMEFDEMEVTSLGYVYTFVNDVLIFFVKQIGVKISAHILM